MSYPTKKICGRCGKPFETSVQNQEWCLGCLLKPSNFTTDIDDHLMEGVAEPEGRINPEEYTFKKHFTERKKHQFKEVGCTKCGVPFIPTGPRDRICKTCREKVDEIF